MQHLLKFLPLYAALALIGVATWAANLVPQLDVAQKLTTYGNQVAGHNAVMCSPADPTGTASGTLVMAGFACAFTPASTGAVMFHVSGTANNSTIGDGCNIQISYGTGTAPLNGAAVVGTQVGQLKRMVASTAAGYQGLSAQAEVTGLVLGTAYWFDIAFEAITGGTCNYKQVDFTATEN